MELQPLSIYWLERMGQNDRLLNSRRMSGPGYVAIVDGEPIAVAGLGRICGREFFAWAIFSEKARSSKLLMRQLSRQFKTKYPIVRDMIKADYIGVETPSDPKFCRWLEMLGFTQMPIVRYGWVRE